MKENKQNFESEAKMKIGKNTYIVIAHYDDTRESLPDKIENLLKSEVESKIAPLRDVS